MRQLTGHDAHFLYSDTVHANSNITFVQIYDQSTAPGGKVRFKSILSQIQSRLHRSPIFRSKLQRVPLELDYPYWVEDEHFDLEYHVRHIALPKPGDWRQFCIQASRIHARALDLNRPLWEIYVIEGLDSFADLPVGSFAVLTKIHHAAISVEKRNEFIEVLHDLSAEPPKPEPPEPWFPERAPGPMALMGRAAMRSMLTPMRLTSPLTRLAPAAMAFASEMFKPEHHTATRFNSVVSPHRVFDTRRFTLDEFQRIRTLVPGATVNDAVVAVCAGGLRRYLAAHGELPEADLEAVAPVDIRDADPYSGHQPEVPWLRVHMGTSIEDPVERLAWIQEQTHSTDTVARAAAANELADANEHAPAATLAMMSKLFGQFAPDLRRGKSLATCTITNVTASPVPLYLCGARMTYFSAILPIADGMGLVFAVTSYDGRIVVSPTSCRELMPDPEAFTQCVRDSFQEYLALVPAAVPAKAPARAPAKAPAKAPAVAPAEQPLEVLAKAPAKQPARAPARAPVQAPMEVVAGIVADAALAKAAAKPKARRAATPVAVEVQAWPAQDAPAEPATLAAPQPARARKAKVAQAPVKVAVGAWPSPAKSAVPGGSSSGTSSPADPKARSGATGPQAAQADRPRSTAPRR